MIYLITQPASAKLAHLCDEDERWWSYHCTLSDSDRSHAQEWPCSTESMHSISMEVCEAQGELHPSDHLHV